MIRKKFHALGEIFTMAGLGSRSSLPAHGNMPRGKSPYFAAVEDDIQGRKL
jgi:hypothetical protein